MWCPYHDCHKLFCTSLQALCTMTPSKRVRKKGYEAMDNLPAFRGCMVIFVFPETLDQENLVKWVLSRLPHMFRFGPKPSPFGLPLGDFFLFFRGDVFSLKSGEPYSFGGCVSLGRPPENRLFSLDNRLKFHMCLINIPFGPRTTMGFFKK